MRLTRSVLFVALAAGLLVRPAVDARQAAPPPDALSQMVDEVTREVEALRGWTFKQPVARSRVTPEQVRQYVTRRVETELAPGRLLTTQAFLRTIGLIPADCDLKTTTLSLLENQVGGYYDPDTRSMCLVDCPGGMPSIAERMILAHELTHALDDQELGIGRFMKSAAGASEEGDLVAASLTEGSATGLMVQYLARRQMSGTLNIAELQAYAKTEAERSKPLLEAPRYFSTMLASYVCGLQFLARGNLMALMLAPDNKAFGESFRTALASPPRSTEQILHPAKYLGERVEGRAGGRRRRICQSLARRTRPVRRPPRHGRGDADRHPDQRPQATRSGDDAAARRLDVSGGQRLGRRPLLPHSRRAVGVRGRANALGTPGSVAVALGYACGP